MRKVGHHQSAALRPSPCQIQHKDDKTLKKVHIISRLNLLRRLLTSAHYEGYIHLATGEARYFRDGNDGFRLGLTFTLLNRSRGRLRVITWCDQLPRGFALRSNCCSVDGFDGSSTERRVCSLVSWELAQTRTMLAIIIIHFGPE